MLAPRHNCSFDRGARIKSNGSMLRTKASAPTITTTYARKTPRGPVDPCNTACTAPKPANAIAHSAIISKKFIPNSDATNAANCQAALVEGLIAQNVENNKLHEMHILIHLCVKSFFDMRR